MRHRVVMAGGIAAALAACSVQRIVADSVPMDHAFRIDATMQGAPLRLGVDTGSPTSLLSLATAQRHGFPLRATQATITDSTGLAQPGAGELDLALRIGSTTFCGPGLCLRMAGSVGDGLVGYPVLSVGAWLFDAPGNRLHMTPADDAERFVADNGLRVVARLSLGADEWRPRVTVRLDDARDVALLHDTGAGGTSLPADVVDALRLPAGEALAKQRAEERAAALAEDLRRQGLEGVKVTVSPGDGEFIGLHGVEQTSSVHHLRRLSFGGRAFDDLVVTRSADEGLLGRDVLGQCVWLLHGPRRELWLLEKQ